jgi:hypothetical protein
MRLCRPMCGKALPFRERWFLVLARLCLAGFGAEPQKQIGP